jgi:hypothetical protein
MDLSLNRPVDNGESAFVEDMVSGSLDAQRELTGRAMALARKHFNAEEYFELERDLAVGNVEIRLFADGVVLTRGA